LSGREAFTNEKIFRPVAGIRSGLKASAETVPGRRNRSQFEDLMLPHLDAAYNLACWLLRDAHEAEDAVQDAYLKAYEALPQYRGGSCAAWLLKIVRNTCLTMLRRRK